MQRMTSRVRQAIEEIEGMLPLTIDDIPDLKARYPDLTFRLTWPTGPRQGLALEIEERPGKEPR